jgi:hypothetical protein
MATEHYNSKTSKPYAVIFTLQATQTLNENTPRDYRIPRVENMLINQIIEKDEGSRNAINLFLKLLRTVSNSTT